MDTKFIAEQNACIGTMTFLIPKNPHSPLLFLTTSTFRLTLNATAFPHPIFNLPAPI